MINRKDLKNKLIPINMDKLKFYLNMVHGYTVYRNKNIKKLTRKELNDMDIRMDNYFNKELNQYLKKKYQKPDQKNNKYRKDLA